MCSNASPQYNNSNATVLLKVSNMVCYKYNIFISEIALFFFCLSYDKYNATNITLNLFLLEIVIMDFRIWFIYRSDSKLKYLSIKF